MAEVDCPVCRMKLAGPRLLDVHLERKHKDSPEAAPVLQKRRGEHAAEIRKRAQEALFEDQQEGDKEASGSRLLWRALPWAVSMLILTVILAICDSVSG